MSKPFDATTKELLEAHPEAWLRLLLRSEVPPVVVLNADLSTITTEADKLLRVEGPEPWLVHVEFQSSYDATLPLRLQRYNILAHTRHGLPALSLVVLLRREADAPGLTGLLQQRLPDGWLYHEFRYRVVRVWELPVEEVLAAGIGTLPLAPLAAVAPEAVPDVLRRVQDRLVREAAPDARPSLWTATYLLMGLRYPDGFTEAVFGGISAMNMEDSTTYMAILRKGEAKGRAEGRAEGEAEGEAKGRVEEARRILLRQGRRRFGPPAPHVVAAIEATTDLGQIEQWIDRVLDAATWDELLAGS